MVWVVVAGALLRSGLVNPYRLSNHHDAHYFVMHDDAAYIALRVYHQLPAWNPFFCGGIPGIANTPTQVLGPTMLLKLMFGVLPGIHLSLFVLMLLGLEGAYRYAVHLGAAGAGAVLGACAWCVSGRFAAAIAEAQHGVPSTWLVPWVLLGFERGIRASAGDGARDGPKEGAPSLWWPALGGVVMGLMLLEGGIVQVPLGAMTLFLLTLALTAEALLARRPGEPWYAPLRSFTVLGLVSVGVCAIKLVPSAEVVTAYPRKWLGHESYSVTHVLRMLFERTTDYGYWAPGTSYVGVVTAGLALLALVQRSRAAFLRLAVAFVLLALATGHGGLLGLYDLSQKLPLYRDLRCPFRYTFFIALFAAMACAIGLTLLEKRWEGLVLRMRARAMKRSRRQAVISALAALATLAPVLGVAYVGVRDVLDSSKQRVDPVYAMSAARPYDSGAGFRQSLGNRWDAHVWPEVGMGTINCFEETPFPTSPLLRGDLPQEEYPADPSLAKVERVSWSPHEIVLDVDASAPTTVLVNQNFHRAWRSSAGSVRSEQGLLAIDVPAGKYRLTLRFSDPLVTIGAAISLATILALGVLFVRGRRLRSPPEAAPSPS